MSILDDLIPAGGNTAGGARRWLAAVGALALACAVAFGFYQVSVRWFLLELGRPAMRHTRRQSEMMAHEIGRALGGLPPARANLRGAMGLLLADNPQITAAWITDGEGRLAQVPSLSPWWDGKPALANVSRLLGGAAPVAESAFLEALKTDNPALEYYSEELVAGQARFGALGYTLDPAIDEGDRATAENFSRKLAAAFLAAVLAMGAAVAAIVRLRARARRLQRQRDEAEQLAYVGTLASGLAHEIRNPLNALGMQLDMLGEDLEAGQTGASSARLGRIRQGLSGVAFTVQEFLTYAAPGRQRPERIELRESLASLLNLRKGTDSGLPPEIEATAAPGLAVWCDPHALHQILENLTANAVKAQDNRPLRRVRIEAVARGESVELLVDDAGPGVPEAEREKVFEAFFTTGVEGSGLGLPIARRLARSNGGELSLDERPSPLGGARFRLLLPMAR